MIIVEMNVMQQIVSTLQKISRDGDVTLVSVNVDFPSNISGENVRCVGTVLESAEGERSIIEIEYIVGTGSSCGDLTVGEGAQKVVINRGIGGFSRSNR